MKYLSLVISVYNEEESLVPFYNELSKVLSEIEKEVEVIFVNDGSRDKSFEILKSLAEKDKRLFIINFSRNFGHEAAMIAGIDYSKGKNIACLDADLQHPPHYILDMLQRWKKAVTLSIWFVLTGRRRVYKEIDFKSFLLGYQ
jgi:dolichol-phosphate mannosyltransferase